MQCIIDVHTDKLTEYEDDLMDDVIDYALLGICSNEKKQNNRKSIMSYGNNAAENWKNAVHVRK